MALKLGTPLEVKHFLSDVSFDVREIEGDCSEDDRAWVSARQLTGGKERELERLRGPLKMGLDDGIPVQYRDTDWMLYYRKLAFLSLIGAGNVLGSSGKEAFRFTAQGVMNGDEKAFNAVWDEYPSAITAAIARICLSVNPNCDYFNMITPDPMLILRDEFSDVHAQVVQRVQERSAKNLLITGQPQSETESSEF